MNKIKTILLVTITLIVFQKAEAQKAGNLDLKELDKYIQENREAWNIPGLAVAIVKDGETIFAKGYGVKEVGKKDKVDENTLFGIASNTKAFTASALAILVDKGLINWDDKVRTHLPWFELYDPYVSNNITIRDLLSHRSGLKTFSGDLIWYATTHSREEVIRRAKHLEPSYGFREKYGYSNISYLTSGEIIPAVTNKSFDDFVKENFFAPLGMERTNISITEFGDDDNIAQPHNNIKGENIVIPFVNWDNIAAAGGINSSVNEMAEWIKMQLNYGEYKGKQIMSEDVCHELRQPNISFPVSKGSLERFPSMHWRAYGLGWALYEFHGRKVVNHGGGLDGMISKVAFIPEENFGLVILTNNNNSLPSYLTYEIFDRYFGKDGRDWCAQGLERAKGYEEYAKEKVRKDEEARAKNTNPSLALEEYTGTYGGDVYGDVEVSMKDGKLYIQFTPTPIFESTMEHWHYDVFKIKFPQVPSLPSGKVRFILDDNGKPEQLIVDVPNPDFDFTELDFHKK